MNIFMYNLYSSISHCTVSVLTQEGYSALLLACGWGWTEVASLLVKAGATLDLLSKVKL